MAEIHLRDDSRQAFEQIIAKWLPQDLAQLASESLDFQLQERVAWQGVAGEEIARDLVQVCEKRGQILQLIVAVKRTQPNNKTSNFVPEIQANTSFRPEGHSKLELDAIAASGCQFADDNFKPLSKLAGILANEAVSSDTVRAVYRSTLRPTTQLTGLLAADWRGGPSSSSRRDGRAERDPDELSKMHYAWDLAERGDRSDGANFLALFVHELQRATRDDGIQNDLQELIDKTWPAETFDQSAVPPARLQIYLDFAPGCDAKTPPQDIKLKTWNWLWLPHANEPTKLADAATLTLSEACEYVGTLLGDADDNVLIEFFVPTALLSWDFERWVWHDYFQQPRQLGREKPIIVRLLMAADPKKPAQLSRLRSAIRGFEKRWDKIRALESLKPHDAIQGPSCFCEGHDDVGQIRDLVAQATDLGCLVMKRPFDRAAPPVHLLGPLFSAGIPIVIWARSEPAARELVAKASRMLDTSAGEVPFQALAVRKREDDLATEALHEQLTLIYEDGACRETSYPSTFGVST